MWIVITLFAATFQTIRNYFARSLVGEVSPTLNSWARFAFNLPFVSLLLTGLIVVRGTLNLPHAFFGWCLLTALSQLVGNSALVAAFKRSTFAESIVLNKLEVVFAALLGVLFFAEFPERTAWVGIACCGVGVVLINRGRPGGPSNWTRNFHLDLGAFLALSSGMLLVLTSFFLKEAIEVVIEANARIGHDRFEASVYTLFHTVWMQVAMATLYLVLFDWKQLGKIQTHWRRMSLIGMSGFAGSLCWYWAYALALVAYVKAVGQIEMIYSVLISIFLFHDRSVIGQLPGVALLAAGILLVVWS